MLFEPRINAITIHYNSMIDLCVKFIFKKYRTNNSSAINRATHIKFLRTQKLFMDHKRTLVAIIFVVETAV